MSQTFRTAPPAHYISPSKEEMREVAEKIGLSKFSPDLAADLANIAAGGKILPPSAYKEQVKKVVEEKLPAPDSSGYWELANGSYTNSKSKKLADAVEQAVRYHQNVCDFLQTVEVENLPGSTPLEQAMNCLKLLSKMSGGSGEGSGESLPIFAEKAEQAGQKVNQVLDQVESLTQDEKDLLDPDQDAGSGASEGADDDQQKMSLAEDMLNGKDIMLSISRNLDKLTRMQVRKSKKQEADPAGDDIRKRPIRHLGELNRIEKSYWGIRQQSKSYFDYLAVTGGIPVRERVTTIEKKQLLYIIIDCSGSMGEGKRIFKAGGILMNRLKAVIAGEAELYVRLFDTELKQEYHACTPAEAKELIKHFTEKNYSGGSTDISGCARAAQKRIEEIIANGATYRPELVVITDGDDSIKLTTKDFPGTKMHAFVVDTANNALCEIAKATGGVGVNQM
ncbi:hypothetical protein H6776_02560 [Candidatus Nomurabacteria bacterium]|nr:hypothetical protein [Candidatus Nomurabacteria bacterium]